jgi:hypothetical protein
VVTSFDGSALAKRSGKIWYITAFFVQFGVRKPGMTTKSCRLGSLSDGPPALYQSVSEPSLAWNR